jgi:hypothetical protein
MVANLDAALETETETVFTKIVGLWLRIYATVASLLAALETVADSFLMNVPFLTTVANLETELDTDADIPRFKVANRATVAERLAARETEADIARKNVTLRTTAASLLTALLTEAATALFKVPILVMVILLEAARETVTEAVEAKVVTVTGANEHCITCSDQFCGPPSAHSTVTFPAG